MNSENALGERDRGIEAGPQLNEELCNLCDLCVEVCPTGSWHLDEGELLWEGEETCQGCCQCAEICPQEAIFCSFYIVWEDDAEGEDLSAPEGGDRAGSIHLPG